MPYRLYQRPANGGWFVVNEWGERQHRNPTSRSRAQRHMQALYEQDRIKNAALLESAQAIKANYGATAGQTISGALGRGGDGKFVNIGSPSTDKLKKTIQDIDRTAQRTQAKKTTKKRPATKRAAAKKPKQAAPNKSDAQKEQERQAKQAQRQAEREQRRAAAEQKKKQEQRANREKVGEQAGLGTDVHEALTEFASPDEKIQLSPANAEELSKRGLVEKDAQGNYRMTPQGRQYIDAANSGDVRRAADAISEGSDNVAQDQQRTTEKQAREDARAKRRAEVEQRRAEREAKQKEKKGGGGGKAKPTPEQKQAQKDQERATNRQRIAPETGVDPTDADELARSASQPGVPNNRLIDAGLQNERGEATDAGRRYLSAIERGDVRQAQAALQDARDRREREQAQSDRQSIGVPTRRSAGRQNYLAARRSRTRQKASLSEQDSSLSVFKASNGEWRWIIRSGSAFLDRDREIIPRHVLKEAAEYNTARGYHGPLRWYHAGEIDVVTHKAGPGLDIGDCDFSAVIGRTLVESGTFRNERYAKAAMRHAKVLKASLGLTFRRLDISKDGVYARVRIPERSLCPADKARNQLSGSLHVFQR